MSTKKSHLDKLVSESIYIMREAVAEAKSPVMLYSIGKDSAVMLHIALKAFAPVNYHSLYFTSTQDGSSKKCMLSEIKLHQIADLI